MYLSGNNCKLNTFDEVTINHRECQNEYFDFISYFIFQNSLVLTFFSITNVACSCFLDSRSHFISGNEFQFFMDLLRDWQTAMCLLVWHQTVRTRSAQSLEPDFGLSANASFPLSVQSTLLYTGTCCIVNTDGQWKHFTNLLLTTGCYWFAPWPCLAPASSFQNHA